MKKKLLMIPGPTEVSKKVLNVLSKQVEPHYGELWRKKYLMILRKVQELIKTKNNPYILPGSGTNAMEAAICSTLNHEDHVLICYNGYWAERLIEICKSWKLKTHILKFPFNSIVDTKKLENVLKKKKNLKMVLFVHVETSTGAENPVKDIVKICNKFKVLSFVDTVAGLGGTNLNFDKMKIDILASSTQKCLESPAGLGILCISKKAKKFIKKNSKILGWYLNLNNIDRYKKNWSAWHPHGPTTAPVSIYLAFDKALELILKEGLKKRVKRHLQIKNFLRKKLRQMNIKLFIESDKHASSTLTTFLLPKKINLKYFIKKMYDDHDIIISGDLGYINNKLVRIGHMGRSANINYINKTILAIKKVLNK